MAHAWLRHPHLGTLSQSAPRQPLGLPRSRALGRRRELRRMTGPSPALVALAAACLLGSGLALRGAQAATRSAAPAAAQPGDDGLPPAAAAAQSARREALARALTPDSVKVLNNANKHGFASNVLVTKELPHDEKTLYVFGGHSGLTKPRTGTAGVVASAVSKDGSAQAGSVGMAYGRRSKPLYVAMQMDLPARTEQGKRITKVLSDKIREGHEHRSSVHDELVEGMRSQQGA
uniref:Uncharacterized protein n=1 Tax=Alexandrium catenella TaxID=2925 RepID=A0A7S1S1I4_ALECA